MTDHVLDLLPENTQLTPEQEQIMHLVQGHIVLQNQFNQITKHVELIYERIKSLEKHLANKVLS